MYQNSINIGTPQGDFQVSNRPAPKDARTVALLLAEAYAQAALSLHSLDSVWA